MRKKRQIRRKLKHLPARSVILVEDETDLLLFPPLRCGWARRGESKPVVLAGGNARRVVFAVLNLRTGHRLVLVRQHQRAADFQALLELIHRRYRARHVVLLLDGDPSHTAAQSRRLARQFGIELLWLPKRAPELNPLDTLWGKAKDVVCANKQYGSIGELVAWFRYYLENLSNREALRLSGVLSKNFWLKDRL